MLWRLGILEFFFKIFYHILLSFLWHLFEGIVFRTFLHQTSVGRLVRLLFLIHHILRCCDALVSKSNEWWLLEIIGEKYRIHLKILVHFWVSSAPLWIYHEKTSVPDHHALMRTNTFLFVEKGSEHRVIKIHLIRIIN